MVIQTDDLMDDEKSMKEKLKNLLSSRSLIIASSMLAIAIIGFGWGLHLPAILLSALLFAGSYLMEPLS